MKSFTLIKKMMPYYGRYKKILFFDLFFASLTIGCEIILPLIVKNITDNAIHDITLLSTRWLVFTGIFYLVLRLIDAGSNYYMNYVGHYMGAKMETDMRRDLFSHLTSQSFSYYNETKIGQLMSRITTDLFEVTEFSHHCPEEFFIAFFKILFAFIILSSYNFILTLIIFILFPLMVLSSRYFSNKMHKTFREQRVELGNVNSQVEDTLLGIRVVKSFANESIEQEKFEKGNIRFLDIKKNMYKAMAGFHSIIRLFDGFMYITVIILGAVFLSKSLISIGQFTAFVLLVSTLLTSIRRIVEFTEQFAKGITGVERFFEIMQHKPEIEDNKNAKPLKNIQGEIKFENVTFHYADDNKNIFKGLNFTIGQGKNIALVGSSGSGKTTLSNLIPRFFEIESGEILIDNININDILLKSLRDNIGMVQQDIYIFSGTIAENIDYGKPNSSREEIVQAAKDAGAFDFIMALPQGFNTYVGERGVKLSGGQKQRLSIARVFLKNPKILILDEATSALDNESERLIQRSIEKLSSGRTTITIAHRLSTIKNADEIFVISQDGITERGSHQELVDLKGKYYEMLNI